MALLGRSDKNEPDKAIGVAQVNGDQSGDGVSIIPRDKQAEVAQQEPEQAIRGSFARMLVEAGMVSLEQMRRAQESMRQEQLPLARILVRDGLVMSRDLAAFTALHLGLTMVDLRSESLEPDVVGLLPEDIARRYPVLALRKDGDSLTVAMADPTNLQAIQDLTARTGLNIEPVVAEDKELVEHIDIAYRQVKAKPKEDGDESADVRVTAETLRSAQPARFVDMLLTQANHDGASDIHIEPTETRLRIRFRIDGILQETLELPIDMHPTLISRIKILSGMNIAERRRPQDGQLSFEAEDERKIDVRVAVCNTQYGEMGVLRLLDSGKLSNLSLDQLGIQSGLDELMEILKLPYGMVLVAGPTGSGKSTTLASAIMTMNRTELNVITMEDPIENDLPNANQLRVHPEAGVTFAMLLRSILRLDPDVILVGEIRDQETAGLAVEAALTGHLVLSTVHANDSVSTLLRIKDLGVAPYLIASALAAIVAQRMVRRVCTGCSRMTPRPVAEQVLFEEILGRKQERFIYGSGCNLCAQTGYRGRIGIYEIMSMSDELRQLFLAEAPRHELWEQTLKDGTVPLLKDGMLKVEQGMTTPYEVMRVAQHSD